MCPLRYVILGFSILLTLLGVYLSHSKQKRLNSVLEIEELISDERKDLSAATGEESDDGLDHSDEEKEANINAPLREK